MNKTWNESDLAHLQNNSLTAEEVSQRTGFRHSVAAIRKKRQRMGIKHKVGRPFKSDNAGRSSRAITNTAMVGDSIMDSIYVSEG